MSGLRDDPRLFPHLPGKAVDSDTLDMYAPEGSEFREVWEYRLSHEMTEGEGSAFWHGVSIARAAAVRFAREELLRRNLDAFKDEAARASELIVGGDS